MHGHLGGRPPRVRLAAERALAELLIDVARRSLVTSAHDLAEGGLAAALAEACLIGGVGATVALPGDAFVSLFSESAARVVVATADLDALSELADAHGVTVAVIGKTGGHTLEIEGQFGVDLGELRELSEGTLPALFG